MFAGPFDHSIIKRAKEKELINIELINIRNFGEGTHKIVDDTPYGGGIGMVLKVDVLHKAIEHAKQKFSNNIVIKQQNNQLSLQAHLEIHINKQLPNSFQQLIISLLFVGIMKELMNES